MIFRERKWYNESKVIVSHHKLEELLAVCCMCGGVSSVELRQLHGAYVRYITRCLTCGHCRDWANSDVVRRIPLINLMLSAVMLFAGCLPTKTIRMMSLLNVKYPKKDTFIRYQKNYLHGVSCIKFLKSWVLYILPSVHLSCSCTNL